MGVGFVVPELGTNSKVPNFPALDRNSSNIPLNPLVNASSSLLVVVVLGLVHSTISNPSSFDNTSIVVVLPVPAGPLRTRSRFRERWVNTLCSQVRTSATFLICTASSEEVLGAKRSAHGRVSYFD